MRFRATILLSGKSATGIEVPPQVVEALGSGRKPAVTVTVGAYTYRTTVAVMAGKFMIPLSAQNRTAAGVAAGDEVDVDVELDTQPREVAVPADFQAALDADPVAAKRFTAMSYSHRRAHVDAIEQAKTEQTRARRIEKALQMLRGS
jgi:hypothetical protein